MVEFDFEGIVSKMEKLIADGKMPNTTYFLLVDGQWLSGRFVAEDSGQEPQHKNPGGDAVELFDVHITLPDGQVATKSSALVRLASIAAVV